jgi:type IV secretory pathway VirB10-like protein
MSKEYPKAVVLRKGILVIVILVVALIVSLILNNIKNARPEKGVENNNNGVTHTANATDVTWYQDQSIEKISKPTVPPVDHSVSPVSPEKAVMPTVQHPPLYSDRAMRDDQYSSLIDTKAMSAPITANQLTGGGGDSQKSGELSDNHGPYSAGQDENRAFVSISGVAHEGYLGKTVQDPASPFELQAGSIIPGILLTGLNSDLPGEIVGQVRETVYDSISGRYELIPQGSKITGQYDSKVVYGQERVLVVWKRVLFPNGKFIDLEGMPGVDLSGYSGFNDQVNNHYGRLFGSVLLMSVLSAGAQLAQPQNSTNTWAAPSVGQTMAQSLGNNIALVGTEKAQKDLNIQPTLEIRPGYEFNIIVTKDIVFPGAYHAA